MGDQTQSSDNTSSDEQTNNDKVGYGFGNGAYGFGYPDGSGYGDGSKGATVLNELRLRGIGPAESFDVHFGNRMTLFTGDNGLGKSFLLDLAWAVLAHSWAKQPPLPRQESEHAWIEYVKERRRNKYTFDYQNQEWRHFELDGLSNTTPYLVVYLQADGSLSLWDSARTPPSPNDILAAPQKAFAGRAYPGYSFPISNERQPFAYHFTPDSLWNGLEVNGKVLCNGLIHDWVRWQFSPEQDPTSPFQILKRVLQHMSAHPEEQMIPAAPMRTSVEDVRDIPTLQMPYGIVPITHTSAGMQRIMSFTYLLTWAWYEHIQASKKRRQSPATSLILLVDEPESHLHPQWQRLLLPALLTVSSSLQSELHVQIIATTHSPLVLASLEPYFKEDKDRLFLFSLLSDGQVDLSEMPWAPQGDSVAWLTSDIFGLEQARSVEAEQAIAAAQAYMLGEPGFLLTEEEIHRELLRVIPGHDPFWPRWVVQTKRVPS